MPASDTRTLAVLFADICGAARLHQQMGGAAAHEAIEHTLNLMAEEATRHHGTVVKRIGDEVLCVFPHPDDAARAAQAMHARVECEAAAEGAPPIHLRIGMDHGDVVEEDGTVRGPTVMVAARVTAVTRSRQILATQRMVEGLSPDSYGSLEKLERSGPGLRQDLYRVRWPGDGAFEPGEAGDPREADLPAKELLLEGTGGTCIADPRQWSVILGRDGQCDLVVMGPAVSRMHCRISFALGRFTLTDTSTNGTYVRFGDDPPITVAGGSQGLDRSGVLCLGTRFRDADTIVRFTVVKAQPEELRALRPSALAVPEQFAALAQETLVLPRGLAP